MERHKRRWSVIYEGDVGSAWEWCQINIHTSCDVPAPLNQRRTTIFDVSAAIQAPSVNRMFPLRIKNDDVSIDMDYWCRSTPMVKYGRSCGAHDLRATMCIEKKTTRQLGRKEFFCECVVACCCC